MYDPRYRLRRLAMGETVHAPRVTAIRLARPEVVRARTVTVPERGEARTRKIRFTRRVADPSPNAPKLIRLIRTPFVEDVARPRRVGAGRLLAVRERHREPHGCMVRELMGEPRVPRNARPTRDVPLLAQRSRLSATEWLTKVETA